MDSGSQLYLIANRGEEQGYLGGLCLLRLELELGLQGLDDAAAPGVQQEVLEGLAEIGRVLVVQRPLQLHTQIETSLENPFGG